jgi:site-specific recombinase XerC
VADLRTGQHSSAAGDIRARAASFRRALVAADLSPLTVKSYTESVGLLEGYLRERGMPTSVVAIAREHVEAFVTDQLARWKPATAANRFRGAQRFFAWLVEEGELRASPMARIHSRGPA